MRLAFASYDLPNYVGGPNAWVLRLGRDLVASGHPTAAFFPQPAEAELPTMASLAERGVEVMAAPKRLRFTTDRARFFFDEVRRWKADVFLTNHILDAWLAGPALTAAGIPTIAVVHSDDPFYWHLSDTFLTGDEAFRLPGAVAVSSFLESSLRERGVSGPLDRIPCGVDLPGARTTFPAAGQPFRIAYVGRIEETQKRITRVARMFGEVTREVPGTEALLVGDGPQRAEVEALLAEEFPGAPVRVTGRLPAEKILKLLGTCHAFTLLSDYEGLPIALMEAMATGVVPVCRAIRSGLPELIIDGETGLFVSDKSGSYLEAIRALRNDPGRWEGLSTRAAAKIRTGYSAAACTEAWLTFAEKLVAARTLGTGRGIFLPPVVKGLENLDRRRPPWSKRIANRVRRALGKESRP